MKRYIIGVTAVIGVLGLSILLPYNTYARMGREHLVPMAPIEISLDKTTTGKEGTERQLAVRNVSNGEYDVKIVSVVQPSVHPDTDIVVRSGESEVVIKDVESEQFIEESGSDTLVVKNNMVRVYAKLGPDKMYSGGLRAVLTPELGALPRGISEFGTFETPIDLPKTGAGILTGGAAGVSVVSFAVHKWLASRRAVSRRHRHNAELQYAGQVLLVLKTPLTKAYNKVQSLWDARS